MITDQREELDRCMRVGGRSGERKEGRVICCWQFGGDDNVVVVKYGKESGRWRFDVRWEWWPGRH